MVGFVLAVDLACVLLLRFEMEDAESAAVVEDLPRWDEPGVMGRMLASVSASKLVEEEFMLLLAVEKAVPCLEILLVLWWL